MVSSHTASSRSRHMAGTYRIAQSHHLAHSHHPSHPVTHSRDSHLERYLHDVLKTHAYDDVVSDGKKGKREKVKGMIQRWRRAQEDIQRVTVQSIWKDYYVPVCKYICSLFMFYANLLMLDGPKKD